MKEMFGNLTTMMSSLSTCIDQMERGGSKKRKAAFRSWAPSPETASLPDAAPAPAMHLPPPPPQPDSSQDRLALTPSVPQQPPLPGVDHMRKEVSFQEGAPPHLPDVSEVVRTRVAQCLQGAPAPFLLTDEDEEMSLASFSNGYLGIVAEEGSPIREVML